MVPVRKGSWTKWKGISRKDIIERECISAVRHAYAMLLSFLLHYFIKQQQVNDGKDHKMQVQNDSQKLSFKLILQKIFQHLGRMKSSLLTGTNYLHGNKPCVPPQTLFLMTWSILEILLSFSLTNHWTA